MKKKNEEAEHIDAVFEKYSGKNRFEVMCPGETRSLWVAAPSEEAAIVAAANRLGKVWTKYEFYAHFRVVPIRGKGG